jgi:hypothetical protein
MIRYNSTLRNIRFGNPESRFWARSCLCINELPHHISNVEVVIFVDDTNILVIDENKITLLEKIKRVMIQLEPWFLKITWL